MPAPVGPGDQHSAVRLPEGLLEALALVSPPCRGRRACAGRRPRRGSGSRLPPRACVGRVVTRRSMRRSSTLTPTRPSWGTRFSAMSSSLMILMRETTPATMRFGTRAVSWSTPSIRKRIRISSSSGSKWMSDAPSATACPRMLLTSLITGPSWAEARRSVISAGPPAAPPPPRPRPRRSPPRPSSASCRASRSGPRCRARARPPRAQLRPVAIWTSSSARTFAGSAIASSRVSSSTKATGTRRWRRAELDRDQVRRRHVDVEDR